MDMTTARSRSGAKFRPLTTLFASAFLATTMIGVASAKPLGTLRQGSGLNLTSWNPQLQTNGVYVRPVFEGLLTTAPDGVTVEPKLAETWSLSPTEMKFTLRRGVSFHDGTPFNADAVIANIENLRKVANRWADTVKGIAKVVKVDDYTVRFELKEPSPSLPFTLSQTGLYMISPKAIADGVWETKPVGTGPYTHDAAASVLGSKVVFKAYDKYYAFDKIGPAVIEVNYLPDLSARINAVMSGQIDSAEGDPTQLATIEAAGLKNHGWTVIRYHMIFLDRKGVFGDPLVRKAMCMAIPRQQINAARYGGLAKIAPQHFDEADPSFVPGLKGYPDDLEGAKALMAQAGNPKVSFKLPSYDSQRILGQLLKESYAKIGIAVEIVMMPNNEYFGSYYTGKFSMFYNSMTPESGGMFNYYPFRFAKDGKANMFRVDPPAELDATYNGALKADPDKQPALLQKMTQIIHDQALDCGYMDVAHVMHYNPKRIKKIATTAWEPSAWRYEDIQMVD